jgi:ankyrin repeat protein
MGGAVEGTVLRIGRIHVARLLLATALLAPMASAAEIHDAAARGDVERVRTLLAGEPTLLEARDAGGRTPLHHACAGDRPRIARLLVAAGANPAATDSFGRTPLHDAAAASLEDLVVVLLDHGTKVEARDKAGQTPLQLAARGAGKEAAEMLLARGAQPDLWVAAGLGRMTALRKMLADDPKRVSAAHPLSGDTPLHAAAWHDQIPTAALLLEAGANVEAKNGVGHTPLGVAVMRGHRETTEMLLRRGADPDQPAAVGGNLVHLAVSNGRHDLIRVLHEAGADLNAKDGSGRTALQIAVADRRRPSAEFLIGRGAEVDVFSAVRLWKHELLAQRLRQRPAAVRAFDPEGRTPLHVAADEGSVEAGELLVKAGTDVDAVDKGGRTALAQAVTNDSRFSRFLLESKADPNLALPDGRTPLHLAAARQPDSKSMLQLLLEADADPAATTKQGQTILDVAGEENRVQVAATLHAYAEKRAAKEETE